MVTSSMEKPSRISHKHNELSEFNSQEWGLKARISRENTNSRRYSASYIRSFREDAKSFRSNITISSTASSPGYGVREEIDPSTYSFTSALRALQAKSVYTWEYMSSDGLILNSKWSEAEKYICNPLSGEVPLQCLSAKTRLNGRSFRQLRSRFTMSAPLIYPAQPRIATVEDDDVKATIKEEKRIANMTRDVGIQSIIEKNSEKSPSPVTTPSIEERSIKRIEAESEDSSSISTTQKLQSEEEVVMQETVKEEDTKRDEKGKKKKEKKKMMMMMWRCSKHGGCFSWMTKRKRQR